MTKPNMGLIRYWARNPTPTCNIKTIILHRRNKKEIKLTK